MTTEAWILRSLAGRFSVDMFTVGASLARSGLLLVLFAVDRLSEAKDCSEVEFA